MYLEIKTIKEKTYLYKTHGVRDGAKQKKIREALGDLESIKENLLSLGINDDPIEYFKKQVEDFNKSTKLNKIEKITKTKNENIHRNKINHSNSSNTLEYLDLPKNLGSVLLSKIYHTLYLDDICKKIQFENNKNIPFNKVLQLEIFSRIIDPASKINDFKNRNNFADVFNVSKADIYDSLEYFYKYKNHFIKSIKENIKSYRKLDTDFLHTDASNIYVYTKEYYDDENEGDNTSSKNIHSLSEKEKNNLLLFKGYSKEHSKYPLVQFMYVTDKNGIPLNFKAFPGNKPDVSLYQEFLDENKEIFDFKKSIIVADAGFVSNDNIIKTIETKNKYLFKYSLLKSNKNIYNTFKTNILPFVEEIAKEDPDCPGFFKSLNITVPYKYSDFTGEEKTVNVVQKFIFIYSKRFAEKHEKIRLEQLKKVDEIIKDKKKLNDIFKKLANQLCKVDTKSVNVSLDEKKEEKYEEISGFSVLITNDLNLSEAEAVSAYKNQYQIENVFKHLKSDFSIRPVFLKKEESIKSHMLICFLALLFTKIIYLGLDKKYSIPTIQETIKNLILVKQDNLNLSRICGYNIIAKKISEYLKVDFLYDVIDGKELRSIIGKTKKK